VTRQSDPQDELYRRLTQKQIRDLLLPAGMLWQGLVQLVKKERKDVREDVVIGLQRSVEAVVRTRVPTQEMRRDLAVRVPRDAKAVLDAMNPEDEVEAVLAASLLTMKAAEDGKIVDPASQAVLTASVIATEAQEDPGAGWGYRARRSREVAERGYRAAQLLGYF